MVILGILYTVILIRIFIYFKRVIIDKSENQKDKNHFRNNIIAFIFCLLLTSCISAYSDFDGTTTASSDVPLEEEIVEEEIVEEEIPLTDENSTEIEEVQEDVSIELSLHDSLLEYLDENTVDNAIDILENQIGFPNVKFDKKEGTGNYYLKANGISICMIAYSDDGVYKVFIPNSSHTFYEDEQLIETYERYTAKTITREEMNSCWLMAEEIVKNNLKNPKSAKFPSILTSDEIYWQKNNDIIAVKSYVTAENTYGGTVKTDFIVEFKVTNIELYEYEFLYSKIGNYEVGTWVNLE